MTSNKELIKTIEKLEQQLNDLKLELKNKSEDEGEDHGLCLGANVIFFIPLENGKGKEQMQGVVKKITKKRVVVKTKSGNEYYRGKNNVVVI